MTKRTKKRAIKRAQLTVKRVALTDLNPHPRNPRKHPEPGSAGWETLRASLEHDYFDPIVWNRRNGLLVSGHLRAKVLAADGYSHADCVVVDYDEPTHLARMIAANKLLGEDVEEGLRALFGDIATAGLPASLTGYTDAALAALAEMAVEDGRDGDKAGASPWDRVGAAADGVMFSFGDVQCRLTLDCYDAFSGACPDSDIAAWLEGVLRACATR